MLFLAATPNFFGIGELWSGILIGLAAIPLLIGLGAVAVVVSDWRMTRKGGPLGPTPPRPAGSGVLICDYIDFETLRTTASQSGLTEEPNEIERGTKVTTDRSAGLTRGGITGRLGRRRSQDERAKFLREVDPNVLLSRTLDALEEKGDLSRHLADTPSVSLGDPNLEHQLEKIAEEFAEAMEAREAIGNVRSRLISAEKRREFEAGVRDRSFVLVESRWKVEHDNDRFRLSVTQLRPPPEYGRWHRMREDLMLFEDLPPDIAGPRREPEPIAMPNDISIETIVLEQTLTKQGAARILPGSTLAAGVFGTSANYSDGVLTISPIAVFARQGVPEPI